MTLLEAIKAGVWITCKTEEEVAQLSEVADSLGYHWNNGQSFLTLNYNSKLAKHGQISYRVSTGHWEDFPKRDAVLFSGLITASALSRIY